MMRTNGNNVVAILPKIELNGQRIQSCSPTHNSFTKEIYLVDNGFKRWIPSFKIYNNLFIDRSGILETEIDHIPSGKLIAKDAQLIIFNQLVYFVENGIKRLVRTQEIMDKYAFSSSKIQAISAEHFKFLKLGVELT